MRRLALLACLCSCAIAVANSPAAYPATYTGTLGPVTVTPDGSSASAPVSGVATCDGIEYCGFFLEVTTVPAAQPCAETITGSSWVGTVALATYGQTVTVSPDTSASWQEWPTSYSGPKTACLYARANFLGTLIDQTSYAVPAPPPPPVYTPPTPVPAYTPPAPTPPQTAATSGDGQHLGDLEAQDVTRSYLKRKYGRRWTAGTRRTVACPVRSAADQIGCYGVWIYRQTVYTKSIVITETADSYQINSSFLTAPPRGTSTDSSGGFCETHVCIPNFPNGTGNVVQCSDGSYSHSGGKQGACSYHGGVAHVAAFSVRVLIASSARSLPDATAARSKEALDAGLELAEAAKTSP